LEAGYDQVQGCLAGTRTHLLDNITHHLRDTAPNQPRIIWVNGLAGAGKSAIASSVSQSLDGSQNLGGTFFFSRNGVSERVNSKTVFVALARQMVANVPWLSEGILNGLKQDVDITSAVPMTQFTKLISGPLQSTREHRVPTVLVLDALDECTFPSQVLEAISQGINQLPSVFKFLITSRPDVILRDIFHEMGSMVHQISLSHDADVDGDIDLFMSESLSKIARTHELEPEWPGHEIRGTLVKKSAGLFIWASTVVKFLGDEDVDDPEGRLEIVLNSDTGGESGLWTQLDSLYAQVLDQSIGSKAPERRVQLLKMVLGAVVVVQNPLSANALGYILEASETHDSSTRAVSQIIRKLRSVLVVPESTDEPIKIIHPSFVDYLTSPERCFDSRFLVDTGAQHRFLAGGCLQVMHQQLRVNICELKPFLLDSEVEDLADRIARKIPEALEHACRFWADHIFSVQPNAELHDLVKIFFYEDLLAWLEVSGLLGAFSSASHTLNTAVGWLKVRLPNFSEFNANGLLTCSRDS
jgi:hypothetical protein